jgi:hypothetical protein
MWKSRRLVERKTIADFLIADLPIGRREFNGKSAIRNRKSEI